jgi:hypothetical protein
VAEERDVMPQCGIYIMDADGTNVKQLVKDARTANLSPDGKLLTFERRGKTISRNLATGEEFDGVQPYFGLSRWPESSPDGKRILVASMGDTRGTSPGALNLMATIFEFNLARTLRRARRTRKRQCLDSAHGRRLRQPRCRLVWAIAITPPPRSPAKSAS